MTAHLSAPPAQSYWHATSVAPDYPLADAHQHFDAAIIGAGFTGLNAAIALAEAGLKVAVLDAHNPGWGASGRNGGFCCLGGDHLGIAAIQRKFGASQAKAYCQVQLAAIETVKNNCTRFAIDADLCGRGETLLAHKASAAKALAETQKQYEQHYSLTTQRLSPQTLVTRGQNSASNLAGLFIDAGFGLHPLKYCYGLVQVALNLGVAFFNQTQVTSLTPTASRWCLETKMETQLGGQPLNATLPLHADKVLFATNGYTQDAMHPSLQGSILAAQSNILVTRPLTAAEKTAQHWHSLNPSYDTRNLLYYFRLLPDNRFLFGGRSGISQSEASFAAKRQQHTLDFHRYFPAWAEVNVDYFWRGHIALSRQLTPHISTLGPNLYCALAYHGNGVAMGSWCGTKAADVMLNRTKAMEEIPMFMRNTPKCFPLPMLRDSYLATAYLAYSWLD